MVSSKKDSKCENEIHPTNEQILAFLFFPLIIVAIAKTQDYIGHSHVHETWVWY